MTICTRSVALTKLKRGRRGLNAFKSGHNMAALQPRARRCRGRARRLAASCHRALVGFPTPHGCRTAGERAGWSLCALPPAPCAPF